MCAEHARCKKHENVILFSILKSNFDQPDAKKTANQRAIRRENKKHVFGMLLILYVKLLVKKWFFILKIHIFHENVDTLRKIEFWRLKKRGCRSQNWCPEHTI